MDELRTWPKAIDEIQAGQDDQAAYLRAANALRGITDFDRGRMTPDQAHLVAEADAAATKVGESRGRLAALSGLLVAAQSGATPDSMQQLIDGVARITAFDESFASPDQLKTLEQARETAIPAAWRLLKSKLAALSQSGTIADYSSVAVIYDVLKRVPATTDEENSLMARASQAAAFIPASDDRLKAMSDAAGAWKQTGMQARAQVLAALKSVTQFDESRFTEAQSDDWSVLNRAAAIIDGPATGLTSSNRDRLAIFVYTNGSSKQDRQVAGSLGRALSEAGYQVTGEREDAALLTEVSIQNMTDPQLDTTGAVATNDVVAELNVVTRWASDDTVLFSGAVSAAGDDPSGAAAAVKALRNAIQLAVGRLQQATGK